MTSVGTKRLQPLLIPLLVVIFGVCAIVGGRALASLGQFDAPTNVLFEADCSRVIENSTDLAGEQARARLHPLHVLLVAPVGTILGHLVGPQLATVLITALLGIGVLYNVERILAEQLELPWQDRALLVFLLGASASQVTFTMVPDTHMLSAFALSGMARTLTPRRLEALSAAQSSILAWLRAGGAVALAWSALAVGVLGTNIAAVFVLLFLLQPGRRFWSRVAQALVFTTLTFVVVFSLHLAQRKAWPPGPSTVYPEVEQAWIPGEDGKPGRLAHRPAEGYVFVAPKASAFSPPPPADVKPAQPSLRELVPYVRWVWATNTRFMTPPKEWPGHVVELLPRFFVVPFFVPRFGLTPKPHSHMLAATFELPELDFRAPALLGIALTLLLGAYALRAARARRAAPRRPLTLFNTAIVVLYLLIISWYGDEGFLFSPNWVFAVLLGLATLYATALSEAPNAKLPLRVGLACLAGLLTINSALHVRELFVYLASAPRPLTASVSAQPSD